MQDGGVPGAIGGGGPNKNVVRSGLRVFDVDIEEAIFGQDACLPQLELAFRFGARGVSGDELLVGEGAVRISIGHPHEAVGGRIVRVPINFLHILTVISLRSGYAEKALLQKRVAFIPESEGETEPILEIRNTTDSVFIPAIGTGTRMIVRQVVPGIAIGAVIFPHRPPGAVCQVRAPAMPVLFTRTVFLETGLLGVHPSRSRSAVCGHCRFLTL